MTALPDLRGLTKEERLVMANAAKNLADFRLPELKYFNDQPCKEHAELSSFCQQCGVQLLPHQRVALAWLYLNPKSVLAYSVGLGKTFILASLFAVLKEMEEVSTERRVLYVTKAGAVHQVFNQLNKVLPSFNIILGSGIREKRIDAYLSPWEICVISYPTLSRDYDMFRQFGIDVVICDDVDPLRNRRTISSNAIQRVASNASRISISHATAWQKRLLELYSAFELIGGVRLFGSERQFKNRYITFDSNKQIAGYRNMDELKAKIDPFVLRRTPSDVPNLEMPALVPNEVHLALHPAQRAQYDQLRRGILEIQRQQGTQLTFAKAQAAFTYGNQICLGTIGDEDRRGLDSVKLDWIEDFVDDTDEKVVVFIPFKQGIRNLSTRLDRMNIGHGIIWGEEANKKKREETKERFWYDDSCRVLLGTSAIASSLNLQVSRHLISAGVILNAAQMQQLAGRVQRINSQHSTVFVHSLYAHDTQESRFLDKLRREQAMNDYIFSEQNELFSRLSPLEMSLLIRG